MGIFDVSPLGWITKVADFSQTSLENTMGTVKQVHQAMVEIPINIAQELGLPEEDTKALKDAHRRMLDPLYDGVCEACGEVNQYIVKQATTVNQLFDFKEQPSEPNIVKLDRKKVRRKKTKSS